MPAHLGQHQKKKRFFLSPKPQIQLHFTLKMPDCCLSLLLLPCGGVPPEQRVVCRVVTGDLTYLRALCRNAPLDSGLETAVNNHKYIATTTAHPHSQQQPQPQSGTDHHHHHHHHHVVHKWLGRQGLQGGVACDGPSCLPGPSTNVLPVAVGEMGSCSQMDFQI